ncbi:hypothetical protein EDC94DRAFT_581908 [Helicostylum pulchrum]|nr:hypothetical protein EDC94DRAFT_581908 [Helicostylum pulchrum]
MSSGAIDHWHLITKRIFPVIVPSTELLRKILSCKNNRIPHQQYVRAQNILANSKAKHTTEEQNMLLKRKAFLLPKINSGYSIEDYSFQARTANLITPSKKACKALVLGANNNLVLDEDSLQISKRPVEIDDDNAVKDDEVEEEEEADNVQNEEDQAADYVRNGQNVIPSNDDIITVGNDKNNDLCAADILTVINLQYRILGKNICERCREQYNDSQEYQGVMTLAMRLFESQASIHSWPDKAAGINGPVEVVLFLLRR